MNFRNLTAAFTLALAALALGCSNKCKSVCDDHKKCADAVPGEKDCDKFCDDTDNVADTASCGAQKDDFLDCMDGLKNVCDDSSCTAKLEAWNTCTSSYCQAHTTDAHCVAYFQDIGVVP